MNIENSSFQLNRYQHNIPAADAGRADASLSGKPSGNAMISQVPEGQMFQGTVVDINGSQVTIQLEGNTMLQARMAESVNMNIGDALSFLVKENMGSTVLIQPFEQNTEVMKDNAIFKLLEQNNLSPSEKNYAIAEAMLEQNMSVDRSSMQRLIQQAYKYPDASIPTLVSMNKMNLPVNGQTIGQFELYETNKHQIMQGITEFADEITDMAKEVLQGNTPEQAMTAYGELLQVVSDASDQPVFDVSKLLSDMQGMNTENVSQLNQLENTVQYAEASDGLQLSNMLAGKLQVGEKIATDIIKQLQDMGISKTVIQEFLNQSDTPLQFMNHLQELLKTAGEQAKIPSGQIQQFLLSDSVKEALGSAIKDKFTLNPEQMKQPEEVKELYKSIYEKANHLMERFGNNAGADGQSLSESAKNMQERIDFMQQLSQFYSYAQLPVRLDGRENNADLYVYMNKKRMQEKKEDVSALLHLDMDYLGPTDVHVSLRGSIVHTRFYVEDAVSAKLIDEHMTMLEKAIAENGFSLTNEVIVREPTLHADTEKNPVIREMFGDDMEKSIKRYSFDVRT